MADYAKETLMIIGDELLTELKAINKISYWKVLQFDIQVSEKISRIVVSHDVHRDDYEIAFQYFCLRELTVVEIARVKRIVYFDGLRKAIRGVVGFYNENGVDAQLEVVQGWDDFEIRIKED